MENRNESISIQAHYVSARKKYLMCRISSLLVLQCTRYMYVYAWTKFKVNQSDFGGDINGKLGISMLNINVRHVRIPIASFLDVGKILLPYMHFKCQSNLLRFSEVMHFWRSDNDKRCSCLKISQILLWPWPDMG